VSVNTAHEIEILKSEYNLSNNDHIQLNISSDAIKDYGTLNGDGQSSVSYGILFDKTADTRE
jgi:hypothetical protein